MKSRSLLLCLLLAVPTLAPAANKEIENLQRDVNLLQQQIRDLQKSQDEKLAAITELARRSIDAANQANTSVAVITNSIEKNLKDQTERVATPVQGLSSRLNDMGGELRTLSQAVSDLTQLMVRMQAQLTDINNAIKVLQAPPVAPPPQPGQTGQPGQMGQTGQPASASDVPSMPATKMYDTALSDYRSGKYDFALQEFADYLKYYGNTDFAPNAQFYIAMIHFVQGNYEPAVKEFDMVLEKYPDNNKTAEALLYKGKALVKIPGHKTEGADEFLELIRRYPKTDQAVAACTELKAVGRNCGPPASAPAGRAPSKRKK